MSERDDDEIVDAVQDESEWGSAYEAGQHMFFASMCQILLLRDLRDR